jgi:hypothetical protein
VNNEMRARLIARWDFSSHDGEYQDDSHVAPCSLVEVCRRFSLLRRWTKFKSKILHIIKHHRQKPWDFDIHAVLMPLWQILAFRSRCKSVWRHFIQPFYWDTFSTSLLLQWVRLCLCRTATANGPIVHPPNDTWMDMEQTLNDKDKG